VRALLDSPERSQTIYAVSRSPPSQGMLSLLSPEQQARIKRVSIDLTGSADKTSQALKKANVQANVVFFYGYITPKGKSAMDPSMADALAEVNVPIFTNLLEALGPANIEARTMADTLVVPDFLTPSPILNPSIFPTISITHRRKRCSSTVSRMLALTGTL
jgi:hypothetical protein